VAVGVDGLFLEVHPDPEQALSDGLNMVPLHRLEALLRQLLSLREAIAGGVAGSSL
jgi:2-dehydro-3-deoxyphosphooctonate aldolase (KDO 8-P synthase)